MKVLFWLLVFLRLVANEAIYGVMITGHDPFRIPFARLAIESFLEQTYTNKTLLIVNHGTTSLGPFQTDSIIEICAPQDTILGALRNIALDYLPENCLWVQWDDDDWRHPKTIEAQYHHLISNHADLCFLKNKIQYIFTLNCAWEDKGTVYGSIMARNSISVRYREVEKSEDFHFLREFGRLHKTVSWNNPPYYYLRFIHGHNTWDATHFKLSRRIQNEWNINEEAKLYLSSTLLKYHFWRP